MDTRLFDFVAEDAWLFVAIVTLPIGSLAALVSFEALAGAVFLIGWFLLVPVFLFWGEEIATLIWRDRAEPATKDIDPVAELKARYARGEIDEREFERRLGVLLETEDVLTTADRDRETDPA